MKIMVLLFHFFHFKIKGVNLYEKLEKELGADYELISELEKDKHMYMDNRIFADK